MNTTKSQRQGYKDTVKEFGKFDEGYGAHVILNLCDDIDTLESENARLKEALEFYADGDGDVLDWDRVNNSACMQDKGKRAREALSTVDALLKSEDKE